MATRNPLYISFLWHMHQPWYLWDERGEAAMPWVRLHALKDYYDMAYLADKMGMPVTINLVPSLLKQIELLASGESTDAFWEAFLPEMKDMNEAQLNMLITNFFSVNSEHFIKPSACYRALLAKKGSASDWRVFSPQEIRDLQVHFILSWFGQTLREMPEIKELIHKDRGYSIEDKNLIIKIAQRRISEIIPYYRQLAHNSTIQLTTSPYYHPILPLLCDLNVAKVANPLTTLPKRAYIYPGDASRQVKNAIEYFEKLLQTKPLGMWLSEGSVSEEILTILIDAAIYHIFSDEDILRKSLEMSFGEPVELTPQRLYRPYRIYRGRSNIDIFFRDRRLSDKIGFVYYSMDTADAVSDFINSLQRISEALPSTDEKFIVSIILDGENAWEYYKDNGKPFLTELYSKLLQHKSIVPTTFEAFLAQTDDVEILDRLAPGSWIGGNFDTWCGSPEKNKAWELLSETRENFQLNAEKYPPSLRRKIMERIMIAEGSDWFWWFGETNYTPYIDVFDALFRFHLRRVYQLMEQPIPSDLEKPIQIKERPFEPVRKPLQFMSPSLEGKATTYFEWSSAGFYKASGFRGAMYGAGQLIMQRIFFGFDPENLYLRLDSTQYMIDFLKEGGNLMLSFLAPRRIDIKIGYHNGGVWWKSFDSSNSEQDEIELSGAEVVCDQICEMKLPFVSLGANPKSPIRFVVYVKKDDIINQRFPPGGQFMEIIPPDEDFEDRMWYV